jgi:membrane protease YdiL (CAAX protease family)
MSALLVSTLFKVALPVVVILIVIVVSRLRRFSLTEDLRLVWPRPTIVLLWLAIWGVWMVAGELAIGLLGMEQPVRWPGYPPLIVALRILAIGLLGPVAEELVVRGLVFFRISRTKAGPWGAIVICAALWAVAHMQYDWRTIVMIFFDGLILGTARHRSRSTFVPMLMHIIANLYSILQSLGIAT